MEMRDFGETPMVETVKSDSDNKKYYPTLSLSADQVPELANKKLDDECKLVIKGRIKGMNDYDGKKEYSVEIKEGAYYKNPEKEDDEY